MKNSSGPLNLFCAKTDSPALLKNLESQPAWKRGTSFQQKVWKKLLDIPYGETRSYAWVAEQIGKPNAVRAVGSACGKNPFPILVPCHRVLTSSGKLGGFAWGLPSKRLLLHLEKVALRAKIR